MKQLNTWFAAPQEMRTTIGLPPTQKLSLRVNQKIRMQKCSWNLWAHCGAYRLNVRIVAPCLSHISTAGQSRTIKPMHMVELQHHIKHRATSLTHMQILCWYRRSPIAEFRYLCGQHRCNEKNILQTHFQCVRFVAALMASQSFDVVAAQQTVIICNEG